ncbi:CsxC family protein [Radiobacillus sp. PE A8.2]|uniref:CsxC family protein n=1 Tax=Radiobacillus sp. PE A8.2 TaxID=3380349 RepID=UPI00389115C3
MSKDKNWVSVNKSASVEQCEVTNVDPVTTPAGTRILRVPVTLAEVEVNSNLVANIHFPDPVLEIKDIKKRLKLVQCRLLTNPASNGTDFSTEPLSLFLKGYVRKNIQYASPCPDSSDYSVSSQMKSFTVDIPFQCVTRIETDNFLSPVLLPQVNTRSEFDFFREQDLGKGFPEKDHLLSSDLSQFHQESAQFYNQLPYCELLNSHITEFDEAIDRKPLPGHKSFEEGTFQEIVEKMFLRFTIKILQNQQIEVNAL